MRTRVAAVDCGTNTLRLLVAELDPVDGAEVELVREERIVRLGQGVDGSGRLAGEALARVFAALDDYVDVMALLGVRAVRFCATSAARDARNASVLLRGAEERLGSPAEVISGAEEARLTFLGATRRLRSAAQPVLVVDVGGGSTEVVLGVVTDAGPVVHAAASLDVGSVRLTERRLAGDPPTAEEVAAARADVDAALDSLPARGLDLTRARTVVAVSGTGVTLAAAVLDLRALPATDGPDGSGEPDLPVADVHATAGRLTAMSVAERLRLPYLPPGRADVIAAGAIVLTRVLARTSVDAVRVSTRDLLDGIAWSLVTAR